MIIFALFKFILFLGTSISNLISYLPTPNIEFSWSSDFLNMIDIALYLIPLAKLEPLLIVIFLVFNLRIVSAIIKKLISVLPTH